MATGLPFCFSPLCQVLGVQGEARKKQADLYLMALKSLGNWRYWMFLKTGMWMGQKLEDWFNLCDKQTPPPPQSAKLRLTAMKLSLSKSRQRLNQRDIRGSWRDDRDS